MPAHSHRTSSNSGTQCLLLAPRGPAIPAELADGLRQRGVELCEVSDLPAAMVALARRPIATLVFIEPAMWTRLNDLAEAVQKYHPTVALWQYRSDAQPRLSHFAGPAAKAASSDVPASQKPVQRTPAAPAAQPVAIDLRPSQRNLLAQEELRLTEEELAMLLDDDEDVGGAGGSAG